MAKVRKRESAKRDLIAQWVWYAEQANIETADRFLAAAESTASMLANHPESGLRVAVAKPELQGVRRFPLSDGFDKFLMFYFPLPDGIEMVRVIQSRRNLDRLLSE